ncbi:MAG: hypothetical protein N3B12_06635 [Armatimonadetes bacterium]|nr:hypothetical protein [Armatimonadota bacterium]
MIKMATSTENRLDGLDWRIGITSLTAIRTMISTIRNTPRSGLAPDSVEEYRLNDSKLIAGNQNAEG